MELDDVPAPEHVTFEPDMISNQMLRDTVSASKTKSRNNGFFFEGPVSLFFLLKLASHHPFFAPFRLRRPPFFAPFRLLHLQRSWSFLSVSTGKPPCCSFPFLKKIDVVHRHVYVDIHILDPFLFTAPPNHLIFWKLETPLPSCPFLGGVVWIRRACACTASGCQGCRPGRDV